MPTVQKSCFGLIGRALLGFLLLAAVQLPAAEMPSANLRYTLEQLESTGASLTAALPEPQTPSPASSKIDGDNDLAPLLQLAGKKERKIIERILDIGEQTGVIKVEQIKQKLSRINVPAVVELYRDVRSLKLAKLDAARIEKIQATLAEIDASLAGKALSGREVGDLAFFAALARDQLANKSQDRSEKARLRGEAVANYQQTVEQLSWETDHASREKVADASERIVELQYEFGNLVPLAPASGNGRVFLTSDYGTRIHPVSKVRRFHAGIDLAGWKCDGWKVMSIGSGRIVKSGWEGGYGYAVVVAHDLNGQPLYTRYAHLRKAGRLNSGVIVKTGDRVGYCNNTGVSTGSHLHFEVRTSSESGPASDPKAYLPKIEKLK